jgi:lactate permease
MLALLALIPILVVLVLMLFLRLGSHWAGMAGWAAGLAIALLAFGLNWQVFWVSQVKGLLLTLNVLYILWPALFLYHLADQAGGVRAIAQALQQMIPDTGWLKIILAWMFTGLLENMAGFGLPITIGAPMLVAVGVSPLVAVAAAAIGHSWAVTSSGMALAFRALADITKTDQAALFPSTAILLAITIFLTGLAAAWVLGEMKHWRKVLLLAVIVSAVLYLTGIVGLIPISSFIPAIVGILAGVLLGQKPANWKPKKEENEFLLSGSLTYGFLILAIMAVTLIKPVNAFLSRFTWTLAFPAVTSNLGFNTPAGNGYMFRFLVHSGTLILLTALVSIFVFPRIKHYHVGKVGVALSRTVKSAIPSTLGTLFMIGLATLMEHTGMTLRLAQELSTLVGAIYPLFAPLVGMVGAFVSGSNTNSNVLFGVLQKNVAELLKLSPLVILAGQTVGGALGSMVAPAKLAVGSSTTAVKGREGEILRLTLPIGLASVIIVGLAAWLLLVLHVF